MHKKYLGDSFDIVKRFWADRLGGVAPLFAHPKFVPLDIQEQYERMVGMRLLPVESPPERFGLFLDPHTGIPLPTSSARLATASHATLSFIVDEFGRLNPTYMVCFDQSHDRSSGLSRQEQRDSKRRALQDNELFSFYYVSHAPFIFMARNEATVQDMLARLTDGGVPRSRFEHALDGVAAVPVGAAALQERHGASTRAMSLGPLLCPACGRKEFKRWPWGWDAHAAHSCQGLTASEPEARKAEFKHRFGDRFGGQAV